MNTIYTIYNEKWTFKYFEKEFLSGHNFSRCYSQTPGKEHSIELGILYQMLFFRVSGDKISQWPFKDSVQNIYGHSKILFKTIDFHFFSLPVEPITGLGVAEFRIFGIHIFVRIEIITYYCVYFVCIS